MKIRILDGTVQYKRKEYSPEKNQVIDLPEDVVESLKKSQTCEIEIVEDENIEVVSPGAITDVPTKIQTKKIDPAPQEEEEDEEEEPNEGTVDWYKQELDELGVKYSWDARKDDLVELYNKATGQDSK